MTRQDSSSMPPPGWYQDPERPGEERWWDGQRWTDHRKPLDASPSRPEQQRHEFTFTASGDRTRALEDAGTLANPGLRLAAFILDIVLIWGAALIIGIPAFMMDAIAPSSGLSAFIAFLSGLAMIVFLIGYPILAEGRLGQTYAKHLLDIRIVSTVDHKPIGSAAAFGRGILRGIGLYVLGLGVLWMLWDDRNQGWHDKAVNSLVVQSPSATKDNPIEHLQRVLEGQPRQGSSGTSGRPNRQLDDALSQVTPAAQEVWSHLSRSYKQIGVVTKEADMTLERVRSCLDALEGVGLAESASDGKFWRLA